MAVSGLVGRLYVVLVALSGLWGVLSLAWWSYLD